MRKQLPKLNKLLDTLNTLKGGGPMSLVNVGFSNVVNKEKIVGIVSSDSSPIKRVIAVSKSRNMLIDASGGKKTKSVIVMSSYHVILSSLSPEVLTSRLNNTDRDVQDDSANEEE